MVSLLRTFHFLALTAAVVLALIPEADAQPGRGGRGGRGRGGTPFGEVFELLRRDDVRQELQLDDAQIEALENVRSSLREDERFRDVQTRMSASDEERQTIIAEARQALSEKVNALLKPEQVSRLQQLNLQRQGVRALESSEVIETLKLSDDQQTQIRETMAWYSAARRELLETGRELSEEEREAKREKTREQLEAKLSSVLTPAQQQDFEQQQGKTFAFTDDGGARTESASTAPDNPAAPTRAAPVAVPGVTVPADPDASAASLSNVRARAKPASELTFSFRFEPWPNVLQWFAGSAGLTLDLSEVPPGTFNYFDNGKYTPTEALDILNGYLLQKGFILIRRDRFLVVINIDRGIPPNLIPTVSIDDVPKRGRNELMTVLLPLNGMTPDDVAAEIEPLLGPQGKVVPLSKTGKVVVTDIGSNITRIHELISGITIEIGDKLFKQFSLEHIAALDAEIVVRDVFALQPRGFANVSAGAGGDRSRYSSRDPRQSYRPSSPQQAPVDANAAVTVAVDERTNSLLITASPADMKIVEETISAIDVEPIEGFIGRVSREPYFDVYQLNTADAIEVTKTLNVLFPGTVVNEDGRSKRIHIRATPAQHQEIEATIRRLDGVGGGSQLAVIPLGRMDSYTATSAIQSLFLLDGDQAPVVQPHPTGNGLLVRGTTDQVEQIKLLIAQLEPEGGGGLYGSGNIRTIPLGGRDADEFARILERVWNAGGRNRIRTVIPSSDRVIRGQVVPSADPYPTTTEPVEPIQPMPLNPAPPETLNTPDGEASLRNRTSAGEGEAPAEPSIIGTRPARQEPRPPGPATLDDDTLRLLNDFVRDTEANVELEEQTEPAEEFNFDAELNRALEATEEPDQPAAGISDAPITITVSGGNLVVISDDTEALDRLEDTISTLTQAMPPRTQWTVFYLQSADATQTSQVLERLFPTSSVSTTSIEDGGFFSELTSGIGTMGRGLADLTGLNTLMTGPQTLRIIPDIRSNSLFVTGPPHLVNEVEDTLRILDAAELPEQLRAKSPRYISVEHADVGDVAEIIRDVYKEEMNPPQQQQRNQNPIAAMMGGGGSNRGQGGAASRISLTLGIDYVTSRLIVSCSEPMFLQIEEMVRELDRAALEAKRTIRVVSLEHANTTILQQTLGSLMPKVKVSSSSTSNRSSNNNGQSQPQQSGNNNQAEQVRQFFMQRAAERERARQSGGGAPGSGGGGGRGPGGGFPGRGGGGPGGGGFPGAGGRGGFSGGGDRGGR